MSSEIKKTISIGSSITVKDFAEKLNLPVTKVISELMKNGILATINEKIDYESATIIADYLGFETKKGKEKEKEEVAEKPIIKKKGKKLESRPPIVTMFGHVDHGKTKLLDTIRKTNVVNEETGGITQAIGAYQTKIKGRLITFLDTPGHEAFQAMRQRGTRLTDIAVLVVAADDGVKPQTIEAIKYCQKANVPIIVAINKIDKPQANPEKVKNQLAEYGIISEERGGKTVTAEISAKTGEGIDNLLEMIFLTADMENLKANPGSQIRGTVIESRLDPTKGPVATILVKNDTLKKGEYVRIGTVTGRLRRLENFQEKEIEKAYPSQPIIIIGLDKVPQVGDTLKIEKSIQKAKAEALRLTRKKEEEKNEEKDSTITKKIEQKTKRTMIKKLNIILKTDIKGSLEAISGILKNIKSEKVAAEILKADIGDINESDIKMAKTSRALVIGFNVRTAPMVMSLAKNEGVKINLYDIIYKLTEDIKKKLSELLEPEIIRTNLGKLKVIAVFKISKTTTEEKQEMIIGATVVSGKIKKEALLNVIRGGEKIGQGKVEELQIEKKTTEEIKEGKNAGIHFKGNIKIKLGDILEAYEEIKQKRKL